MEPLPVGCSFSSEDHVKLSGHVAPDASVMVFRPSPPVVLWASMIALFPDDPPPPPPPPANGPRGPTTTWPFARKFRRASDVSSASSNLVSTTFRRLTSAASSCVMRPSMPSAMARAFPALAFAWIELFWAVSAFVLAAVANRLALSAFVLAALAAESAAVEVSTAVAESALAVFALLSAVAESVEAVLASGSASLAFSSASSARFSAFSALALAAAVSACACCAV